MSDDVFRWVIAIGVLLAAASALWQGLVMSALFRAGMKALEAGKEAQAKIGTLVEHTESILRDTRKILEENRPRIAEISSETLANTKATHQRVERIGELVDDFSVRAKTRIAQIDHTVDQTVQQVEQATGNVRNAVMTPAREVTGFVDGVKAAFTTYAQSRQRNSVEHATQDEEMFI